MKYKKMELNKLKADMPQYAFKNYLAIRNTPEFRRFARVTHLPIEMTCETVGQAIEVRMPRRFLGLLPGRKVLEAYRGDSIERTLYSGRKYATAQCSVHIIPEVSDKELSRRLEETLIDDFNSLKNRLEEEGTRIVETLSGH